MKRCVVLAVTSLSLLLGVNGYAAPRLWVAPESARVRASDVHHPLSRGEENPLYKPGATVRLDALRGEVVALQAIVETDDAPADAVTIDVSWVGAKAPKVDRFIEQYVEVHQRSHNTKRPMESLGWSAEARPSDDGALGLVPDALVPVELARGFVQYPFAVPARSTRAVWIDLTIASDAEPGTLHGELIASAAGKTIGRIPLSLEVHAATLPYRPVSFFAFYGRYQLTRRMGDEAADKAEPALWQLLHAHQVDALGSLLSSEDLTRLGPALDGSLFTRAYGYVGPGEGVAPEIVAIGAYGTLGPPTAASKAIIEELAPKIPPQVREVLVYAVDEQCDSPRGPGYERLLADSPARARVKVAHTCSRDPSTQDVDVVLTTAEQFDGRSAAKARAMGKQVWVYNGALPHAGTLLLDSGVSALTASGWAAATHDVDRWFLWETVFWSDGNRGGHGPIDPFATVETFHNDHGDVAMLDGLLAYPGTQLPPFDAHSLGAATVMPSIRLKSLRRGIQDAGYLALARANDPAEAERIARDALPAALDEVQDDEPASWDASGRKFFEARARLRQLIAPSASLSTQRARELLVEGAREAKPRTRLLRKRTVVLSSMALACVVGLGWTLRRRRR